MYSLDNDFVDSNGLVNSRTDESNAENSILWTIELYFLMKEKELDTSLIRSSIDKAIQDMTIGKGLYKQNPSYLHPKDDTSNEAYMSHDQLTAIFTYAKSIGRQDLIEDIVDVIFSQYGILYDNKNPEDPSFKKGILHPRDLCYYFLLSNKLKSKVLGLLLYPLLLLITIVSFMSTEKCRNGVCFPKTDLELLYYIKRASTPKWFFAIDWFCNLRIKQRFGSWKQAWSTYFKDPNHPINVINNE